MANESERLVWVVAVLVLVSAAAAALATDGLDALSGFLRLQTRPARLIQDFTDLEGIGAALLNATVVAAMGLLLVRASSVRLSGPTIAAVFTMFGFGLFGKTPLNAVPILLGVAIATRLAGKRYQEYLLFALFGTALGPIVSTIAFELVVPQGWSLLVAIGAGILTGILIPAIAIWTLRMHQGFSLYNIGLACGMLGIVAAAVLSAAGAEGMEPSHWSTERTTTGFLLIPALSGLLAIAALVPQPKTALGQFLAINRESGRLPADFMSVIGVRGSLLNMAVIGMLTWGYVVAVGGPLNGPVLGGILTAIGFAAFGKHPRNSIPVALGAIGATLLFGKDLTAPGPLLAALFVLTLAPLAGEFGWLIGIVAGACHLVLVEQTGAWHLGINLYNNGFAGGLTATIFVAIIEWWEVVRDGSRKSRTRGRGT